MLENIFMARATILLIKEDNWRWKSDKITNSLMYHLTTHPRFPMNYMYIMHRQQT